MLLMDMLVGKKKLEKELELSVQESITLCS
jgi:hypothetical protein